MSTLEIDVGDLRARSVDFTATELVVSLRDGRRIVTPLDWYPRLKNASPMQRSNYEIMPMGIYWPPPFTPPPLAGEGGVGDGCPASSGHDGRGELHRLTFSA